MKQLKLLYIIGSFYPAQNGGPNNTIYWQAKELVKTNIDVTVITTMSGITKEIQKKYNIIPNQLIKIDGVKIIFFDYKKKNYLALNLYIWLFKNIHLFDMVNLTSYFFPMSWASALLCNIKKVKFFLAPRGELEDNAIKYNYKLKKILIKLFLQRLFNKAEFILMTAEQELNFSKLYFRSDMSFEIVPNYIEIPKYIYDINIDQKKNILYLGRLHPKKGIENLIEAYSNLEILLQEKHTLQIAGTGEIEYIQKLKEKAKDNPNIIFLGHKDGKEKELLYSSSKIFVLPSYSENFGNVVLEALMHKTPTIASVYTPWKRIDNVCGFWIDNSPQKITANISKLLLLNEEEYLKYSDNALRFVEQNFDIAKNINNLINIIYKYKENNGSK